MQETNPNNQGIQSTSETGITTPAQPVAPVSAPTVTVPDKAPQAAQAPTATPAPSSTPAPTITTTSQTAVQTTTMPAATTTNTAVPTVKPAPVATTIAVTQTKPKIKTLTIVKIVLIPLIVVILMYVGYRTVQGVSEEGTLSIDQNEAQTPEENYVKDESGVTNIVTEEKPKEEPSE